MCRPSKSGQSRAKRRSAKNCSRAGFTWMIPATGSRDRDGWMAAVPRNIEETLTLLRQGNYIADRSLATAVFLALKLKRPLFLEGEAGVGKTEIAKVLAATLGRTLVRL